MHTLLLVVTPDEVIRQTIDDRQGLVVPETYRRKEHDAFGVTRIVVSCLLAHGGVTQQRVFDHIAERRTGETAGVVIVSDRRVGLGGPPLSDIYFLNEYDQFGVAKSPQNFVASILNRVLRDFRVLTLKFADAKYQKIFRLPLRNFAAAEIADLRDTCSNSIEMAGFADRLDALLSRFRRRQQPKRKSDYQDEYLVDDKGRHFQLGHEHHAQAETKIPPHNLLCLLGNRHRFGRAFDHLRHYNVSMDGENATMDDTYPDCHSNERSGGGKRHLNMFTNDFF
jgi:hypothetical protein